jgi:hypothetical protein
MNELLENIRAGGAKRLGDFAVIAVLASVGYLSVHWLDDRVDARVDLRLPALHEGIAGCATAADCERRRAEIDGMRIVVGEQAKRIDELERYVDKHEPVADIYKRKIDSIEDCCRRIPIKP